jgi:sterol 3beta-glucosyltransferase
MARIGIAALGTLGDVQPFIELGRGLHADGHDVRLSTAQRFGALAEAAGIRFDALPGDPSEMFEAIAFNPDEISPWRAWAHLRLIHTGLDAFVGRSSVANLLGPWADVEFVIFTPTTTFARAAADELGIPSAMMAMTPQVVTGAFSHPVLAPLLDLGSLGNRASWLIGERLQRQTFTEPLKPASRRGWGLAPNPLATANGTSRWPPFPVLHAFSDAVVPRPSDWPRHVELTGWVFPRTEEDRLSEEVQGFLADGEQPLFIGFGSMPLPQPEETAQIIAEALAATSSRAIVSGEALASARVLQGNPSVLTVASVPHEPLFKHVSGVVHHGGSGTVGTGLRAGRPTLVVPTVFDQFFWGRRVSAVGAGPAPLPFNRLTAERLAAALRELGGASIRSAAQRIGERVEAEDGVGDAVAAIERMLP